MIITEYSITIKTKIQRGFFRSRLEELGWKINHHNPAGDFSITTNYGEFSTVME